MAEQYTIGLKLEFDKDEINALQQLGPEVTRAFQQASQSMQQGGQQMMQGPMGDLLRQSAHRAQGISEQGREQGGFTRSQRREMEQALNQEASILRRFYAEKIALTKQSVAALNAEADAQEKLMRTAERVHGRGSAQHQEASQQFALLYQRHQAFGAGGVDVAARNRLIAERDTVLTNIEEQRALGQLAPTLEEEGGGGRGGGRGGLFGGRRSGLGGFARGMTGVGVLAGGYAYGAFLRAKTREARDARIEAMYLGRQLRSSDVSAEDWLERSRALSPDLRAEEMMPFVTTFGAGRTATQGLMGEAKEAVEMTRGLGLPLSQGAALFGGTQRLGIDQKRFADMIGNAVAGSGMHGREAEVMESVLHLSEQLIGRMGYIAGSGQNVMGLLGAMFQTGQPGLRGQFGAQRLQGIQSAIGGPLPFDLDVKTPFLMQGMSQIAQSGLLPDDLRGMPLSVTMQHLRDRGPMAVPGMMGVFTRQVQELGGVRTPLGYGLAREYGMPTDVQSWDKWVGMQRPAADDLTVWQRAMLGDDKYKSYQDAFQQKPGGAGYAAQMRFLFQSGEIRDDPKLTTDEQRRGALEDAYGTAMRAETPLDKIGESAQTLNESSQLLRNAASNLSSVAESLRNRIVKPAVSAGGDIVDALGPGGTTLLAGAGGIGIMMAAKRLLPWLGSWFTGGAPGPPGIVSKSASAAGRAAGAMARFPVKHPGAMAAVGAGTLGWYALKQWQASRADEDTDIDMPGFPPEYAAMVAKAAATHGVDEEEAASLIMAESLGQNIPSRDKRDFGLFQIHHGRGGPAPHTSKQQLLTPLINARIGSSHYSRLQRMYPDIRSRVAAWNLGESRVPQDVPYEDFESDLPKATRGLVDRFMENLTSAREAESAELTGTLNVVVTNEGVRVPTTVLLTKDDGKSPMNTPMPAHGGQD